MLSQKPTGRAVLRVFAIPELAHLICSTVRKRNNASLMRTCRQLFHNVLPFVWEDVNQANPLVSLIPGGGTITYNPDLPPYAYVVMQLPSCLALTRFNIYAPYVKRLTPSTPHIDEYDGWESFLTSVQSIDLLPNLETLNLPVRSHTQPSYGNLNDNIIDADCINWVSTFMSTSLQTLELGYQKRGSYSDDQYVTWMDFEILDLQELKTIVDYLPRLRHIRALLNWSSVTELADTDFAPCRSKSSVTLYLESNFYFPIPQQENAERLARYLSTLRSSGAVTCQSYQKSFYSRAADSYVDERPKDMINAELAQLRLS
ncbi:unnamed protein product [Rhizoctonia solani]|uniref:Uncharacterized protein n=1 Tax=Rhizoctonia solani TaxID=456999 RepID=A0A8H3I329_9AGAM|nr:unnamed protein product [Rhizoctonia solani]